MLDSLNAPHDTLPIDNDFGDVPFMPRIMPREEGLHPHGFFFMARVLHM